MQEDGHYDFHSPDALFERAKELLCLYEIEQALSNYDQNIEDVIDNILHIIPKGWQYEDICEAEIILGDKIYHRSSFTRTELKISYPLKEYDKVIGELRIFYTRPVKCDKGIFLPEEHLLLKSIAEKFSTFLILKKLRPISQRELSLPDEEFFQQIKKNYHGLIEWLKPFGLTDSDIIQLLKNPITFKKGETLGKQGAYTSYFILLAKGATKSFVEGLHGKSYSFMISVPFEFISLSSLYGNSYYFTTIALIPTTAFLIEKQTVLRILNQNPQFHKAITKWLCDNYDILFNRLKCLSLKQTTGRMAETLLYLSRVFNSDLIPSFISRKDLAELSAMSNENAVRILSDFKNENIISDTPKGITLINKQLLQTISIAG
ncbi:MAG: Crp/Fnr family transcriptional regulator [Bacteroidales bacterium]|nr:Crp/Fnr family transcriptional regulator [Bacteroidales bacterium]